MSVFKEKFMQLRGMLVYVCVTKPVNCLDKDRGTEWKAGVVLTDEDQADEFEKACTAIGAKPSLKKVKECVITREVVVSGEKPIMVIEKAG